MLNSVILAFTGIMQFFADSHTSMLIADVSQC